MYEVHTDILHTHIHAVAPAPAGSCYCESLRTRTAWPEKTSIVILHEPGVPAANAPPTCCLWPFGQMYVAAFPESESPSFSFSSRAITSQLHPASRHVAALPPCLIEVPACTRVEMQQAATPLHSVFGRPTVPQQGTQKPFTRKAAPREERSPTPLRFHHSLRFE